MAKKTVLVALMSSVILSAGVTYTKKDRIKDMQTMATAMQDIQNGFYYNNFDMIKVGAISLSNTIDRVEPPLEEIEEKDVMTRYVNNKVQITNRIKKKINRKIKTLLERFKSGDPTQAIQAYTKIARECMACHVQLRKW
ncbi:hypothetical protein MNB_SV-15-526 [hydrothermal vent metagenome]|uniref:Cytochrome C n=1 Tax=hydrothermal vent metagenome TaxID=652676 RepID=A0A1W1EJ72_9ZZZZ